MIKTRFWVAVIALILLLSVGAAFWLNGKTAPGTRANIYLDGVCVHSVDLSRVQQTEIYTVESGGGINVIEIEAGQIRVREADCPDQVCVRAGWLRDSAAPIVCLPHKLVIRLEKDPSAEQIDGVSG